jgi:hypothetical protein
VAYLVVALLKTLGGGGGGGGFCGCRGIFLFITRWLINKCEFSGVSGLKNILNSSSSLGTCGRIFGGFKE